MRQGLFSPRAAAELEAAAAFIAADNPAAATAFLQSALKAASRIATQPALGSTRPPLPGRYRFWPLRRYNYLLVYDADTEPVRIPRVLHTRRDLPRLLRLPGDEAPV